MKIQTFSILAGSEACNARCPFCVSKMTPPMGIELKEPAINARNFRKACLFAKQCGVTTAMITGKGEPTLFPKQITTYLTILEEFQFPFIEIQTNGIVLAEKPRIYEAYLEEWYNLGLNTIAISIVHFDPEKNHEIYLPYKKEYIDLPELIRRLHSFGFSVRLACIMAKGFICEVEHIKKLIEFAKENSVEQLTVRPVNKPDDTRNDEAWHWTLERHLEKEQLRRIEQYIKKEGAFLMSLMHDASVYDVSGQNVCLTHSLTLDPNSEDIRQLIFFPDGHIRYDWRYEGAILL